MQNSKANYPSNTLLPYRRGVGIFILNHEKKVFVGKRLDSKTNAWQMPQGGIDGEETIIEAVKRETYEETGIKSIQVLAESEYWYYYDLPESLIPKFWNGLYRGQKQKWVLLKFAGQDDEINIAQPSAEFLKWKWIEIDALPAIVVPFKRQLYHSVIEEFRPIINKVYNEK
jgi:putative (di)nucleoside polyphosphate hydrolase